MNAQLFLISGTPTNGTNSVWTLTISGATGGYFTIRQNTFNPVVWSPVNAVLIANLKRALENAQTIGVGNVSVTEDSLTDGIGTISIEFISAKAKLAVDPLTIVVNTTGGTVEVEETTAGVTATQREAPANALICNPSSGTLYINNSSSLFNPSWNAVGSGGGGTDSTALLEMIGAIDGVNKVFTFPDGLQPTSVSFNYNGLAVDPADYDYADGVVTFHDDEQPQPTEEIDDDHLFGWGFTEDVSANFVPHEVPSGLVNGINAVFTVANPIDSGKIFPFINGLLEFPVHFTITGASELTFDTPPEEGSLLDFQYWKL